ncbi:MAG: helix-turn-helix domain-containing protein [Spirochaetes bacterium]|nr:helix-turn-helix domain-containing protein [Spirochaetota bacterium]
MMRHSPVSTIMLSSELPKALDAFAACFDLRITVFNEKGERIITGGAQRQIPYCRTVKGTAQGLAACDRSDRTLFERARAEKKTVSHICHGGLLEAVHPVYAHHVLCAYIMLGQIALSGKAVMGKFAGLLKKKRTYSRLEVNSILNLFEILVHHIIDHKLVRIRTDEKYELVMEYMRAHFRERLSVADVASVAGLGKTTVAQLFRTCAGKTFKELLIDMRLDEAERLMREPGMTLREAAFKSGYDDPLFFSRTYRRLRGMTPSAYRQKTAAIVL